MPEQVYLEFLDNTRIYVNEDNLTPIVRSIFISCAVSMFFSVLYGCLGVGSVLFMYFSEVWGVIFNISIVSWIFSCWAFRRQYKRIRAMKNAIHFLMSQFGHQKVQQIIDEYVEEMK